jgi:hypothetical protein
LEYWNRNKNHCRFETFIRLQAAATADGTVELHSRLLIGPFGREHGATSGGH